MSYRSYTEGIFFVKDLSDDDATEINDQLTELLTIAPINQVHDLDSRYVNPDLAVFNAQDDPPQGTTHDLFANEDDSTAWYTFHNDVPNAIRLIKRYGGTIISGEITRDGEEDDDAEKFVVDTPNVLTTAHRVMSWSKSTVVNTNMSLSTDD